MFLSVIFVLKYIPLVMKKSIMKKKFMTRKITSIDVVTATNGRSESQNLIVI